MCLNILLARIANTALWFWPCSALLPVAVTSKNIKKKSFLLLSTQWPPNNYRGDYGGHLHSSSRGGGAACCRTTPKFFANVMLGPVLYLPEFPSEQGEHKQPGLQHLHLLQHKSTSVINIPIPMSSWIFIFNIAENSDFTSPSQHIKNVICYNSPCSRSGGEVRWKNP